MNKAAFLDILNHVTSISEQEVIELEKLALNFPYCQSAHLLLAKAAYDKGSMLSNQRLRRAAACAANRQLLKKLINTAGHHLVLEPIADEVAEANPFPAISPDPQGEIIPEAVNSPQDPGADQVPGTGSFPAELSPVALEPIETEALDVEAYDAPLQAIASEQVPEAVKEEIPASRELVQVVAELEPIELEFLELEALAPEKEQAAPPVTPLSAPGPIGLEPIELESLELEALPAGLAAQEETCLLEETAPSSPAFLPESEAQPELLDQALPEIYEIPELLDDADIAAASRPKTTPLACQEAVPDQETAAEGLQAFSDDFDDLFRVDFLASVVPALDPVATFVEALPDREPAAQSPAAAEESQPQELAVTAPQLAEAAAQIPASEEADETLARFDQFLFSPEKEQEQEAPAAAPPPYQEEILYKVFDANELGYWMDSSRLGETLLRKNELASSQPYYFRPELLLEYSRHHEMERYQAPEPGILARQFDIIDQFLKLNPKIKSMAQVKIKTESQEDLSLKSTKIRKNTASETLATILVQQGKIKKAIKIYEHLILKLPEKKDYFASQIDKLQTLI